MLLYVKGGAAVTDNKYGSFFPVGHLRRSLCPVRYETETRWGGTVRRRRQFFAPDWSIGFEYDHLFMGTAALPPTTAIAVTRNDNIHEDVDMGAVVSYRFGGPVIIKY